MFANLSLELWPYVVLTRERRDHPTETDEVTVINDSFRHGDFSPNIPFTHV